MCVIFVGYLSGITYKITANYDAVIYLYIANTVIISADIFLYFLNQKYEKLNAI